VNSEGAHIHVVAAVLCCDGKYLVCRRNAVKHHGGLWEFPGGKVQHGEDFEAALARELAEELDLDLTKVGETLYSGSEVDSQYLIHFIVCEAGGSPKSLEHEEIVWLEAHELAALDFAPVDAEFVRSGGLVSVSS
jgi:mutator protein MutT